MAQGFVRILNLGESSSASRDRNAINNLGGAGIVDDLLLFSNNNLNKTIITAGTYVVDNGYIVLDPNTYQITPSNRTKLIHNGQIYTVINSNGVDRFQLVDSDDIVITANSQLDIERSDTVTLANIRNIVSTSIPTDQNSTTNELGDQISVGEAGITVGTSTSTRTTLKENFDNIESLIDKYRYDRTFSVITDLPQRFERSLNYESTITITNDTVPAISLPTAPGTTDNAPGIFIASGENTQRAFSNNNNPWSTTVPGSNYMTTLSSQATVGTLLVTDPDFEDLGTSVILPSDVLDDFTHKIETIINGETYYILCSSN
jgi:hypothetical protein